jgi:hypothetical protein
VLLHPAGEETMTDFIIKPLPYDLSNQAGLALIGKYLKRINFNALVDPISLYTSHPINPNSRTNRAP